MTGLFRVFHGSTHLSRTRYRAGSGSITPPPLTLTAPVLGYPSPLGTNPSSVVLNLGVDWITGDIAVLAYSASPAMTSPTLLTHTIADLDITNGTASFPLPTFVGVNYLQAWGRVGTTDSINKSGIVSWGDTTAPTITTSATPAHVVETFTLGLALTATDTGGVPAQVSTAQLGGVQSPGWYISGGADKLQFQIAVVAGVPTLQFYNNGSQSYSSPKNFPPVSANPYVVTVTAVDYGGNATSLTISQYVDAADLTPDAFSWTNDSNTSLSTVYTAANTWTVSGLTPGVNAVVTVTGGLISKNGGAYSASATTVQNGDTLNARGTSSGSYSTGVTVAVTVGTLTANYTITTQANPNAASFTASSAQPAAINNSYGSAVYTFTGVDFIVGGYGVVFMCLTNDARTVSSIKIVGAGTSGADINLVSRLVNSSGNPMQVWTCPDGSAIVNGTARSVVVTLASSASWCAILCGTLQNATTTVPSTTALRNFASIASPVTTTSAVTVNTNGVGVSFWEMNPAPAYTAGGTSTLLTTGLNNNGGNAGDRGAITRQINSGSWTPQISYTGGQASVGALACGWDH